MCRYATTADAPLRNFRRLHCINGFDGNSERGSNFMQFKRMQRAAQIMFVSAVSIAAFGTGAAIGHAAAVALSFTAAALRRERRAASQKPAGCFFARSR